jgi:hypothetical protein
VVAGIKVLEGNSCGAGSLHYNTC